MKENQIPVTAMRSLAVLVELREVEGEGIAQSKI